MSSEDGLRRYVKLGEPVIILFEDAGIRVFNKPPNLHLLSTVGLLRGLERVGVISSADDIVHQMTHPSKPDRCPGDRRVFTDLPDGVNDPAATGSSWEPCGSYACQHSGFAPGPHAGLRYGTKRQVRWNVSPHARSLRLQGRNPPRYLALNESGKARNAKRRHPKMPPFLSRPEPRRRMGGAGILDRRDPDPGVTGQDALFTSTQ